MSSERAIAQGAVTTPIRMSVALGPRTERRTVRALLARSPARSRVMTASAPIVPAIGSITLTAMAITIVARPSSRDGRARWAPWTLPACGPGPAGRTAPPGGAA